MCEQYFRFGSIVYVQNIKFLYTEFVMDCCVQIGSNHFFSHLCIIVHLKISPQKFDGNGVAFVTLLKWFENISCGMYQYKTLQIHSEYTKLLICATSLVKFKKWTDLKLFKSLRKRCERRMNERQSVVFVHSQYCTQLKKSNIYCITATPIRVPLCS